MIGRIVSMALVIAMTITAAPAGILTSVQAAEDDGSSYNLSEGRPVSVSSGNNEDLAVDGDTKTRWQADQKDSNEWLYVDLGKEATIDYLYMHWEAAYAKYYQIQVSNDETNWTTVYKKEKAAASNVEMAVNYNYSGVRDDGNLKFTLNWTSVEDAHYKVYIDGTSDNNIAYAAGDNYRFTNHGGTTGEVRMGRGQHTITVVAFNPENNKELGRGVLTMDAQDNAKGNNGVEVDTQAALKQTVSAANWSVKKARYIKVVTTERATAYGVSLFEFQVWGTGGANKKPVNYGKNLAKGQPVKCSGTRDEWWMKDSSGNITESAYKEVRPENAVDGDTSTSFTSHQGEDDQWIYVDLGRAYNIGRVVTKFASDGAKIYDIQVSADANTWTTIHRNMRGYMNMVDTFTCYRTNVRYVRMLAYSKVESGSGVAVRELEVYEYVPGDSQVNESIPELPTRQIINNPNGKGSYVTGEIKKELNKLPTFVNADKVKTPIDSNSWWSSAMIKTFGNRDIIHPLMAQYSKKGLGITLGSQGFTDERKADDLGMGYYAEHLVDFYVLPDGLESNSAYDRVEGYGDYHVDLGLCDEDGLKMESTFVKGSPYIFSSFKKTNIAFISSSSINSIYDGNGNAILTKAGDSVKTDHIGFTSMDDENTRAKNNGSNFVVCAPANTTFTAMTVGSKTKIKVEFPSSDAYLSYAGMLKKSDIETYYRHGYAHVTDTKVNYTYSRDNSKIVTTYKATTKSVRNGFSDITMQAFYPHQWKHSSETYDAVYPSIRGNMKAKFANTMTTTQQFAGLLPTFAKPNSSKLNSEEIKQYITTVMNEIGTGPNADAYWQGKAVHPLAITALMADQIGETEMRDQMLKDLKKILVDWFTFSGDGDRCYLIYNKDWGTVYYPESAYGANAAICDHHFTYGYFMFGSAVLSTYDKAFYNEYKDMIELMLRDYANPEEPENDGNMFCKFRAFDQYSGHSWAGGYADNDDGNNQESASESLFSWVGMYLWGEASKQSKYVDAGAYGFTTEMEAILQYWFDYDGDNWLPEYPFQGTGQIYGSTYSYGTFFGGQPLYIYGIQWLPISEYLTNYGINQTKCAAAYQGLWDETDYAAEIELRKGNIKSKDEYANPDNGWQHITWPFLSQTNPQLAYEKFEAGVDGMQKEDRANTLWFISAMDSIGHKSTKYAIVGQTIGGSVYEKTANGKTTYTGEVWNPTGGTKTVYVVDTKTGNKLGKAKIASKGLVQFEINPNNYFSYVQASAPKISATGIKSGDTRSNATGTVKFDDTQMVELSCAEDNATIYYTTDGSAPSTSSKKYEGKFMVSSDCTVKAVAVKNGSINSAFASCNFVIDGDVIQSADNLAIGKNVTASSAQGTAANVVDGSLGSHWQANANNDEWIYVDLGATMAINTVKINWEAAFPSKYEIQVSTDKNSWETVAVETGRVGYVTSIFEAVNARYVRMQGVKRATQYGYNMFEMEVYGANKAKAPTISPMSGTYNGSQTVKLDTAVAGAEIKYTTDGSTPNEKSKTYQDPFTVSNSTVVKAITYRKGMVLSNVVESDIIINGTIGLNQTEANIAIGNTLQLAPLTAENINWSSNNTGVASVSNSGLVTANRAGTAVITATAGNKKATCTVTVTEAKHISSVEVKPFVLTMKAKSSDTVSAVVLPKDTTDNKTATWRSSDTSVATVNNDGTITALKQGTATISCTIGGKTGSCYVTVGPQATIKEMITDAKYNLALGKSASVSSMYAGEGSKNTSVLTDGNIGGEYVCTDWNNSLTSDSVIIDLGKNYNTGGIDALAVQFVNQATFGGNYTVELSDTGIDYKKVADYNMSYNASDNGLATIPLMDYSGTLKTTRFVKINFNGHLNWGFQIREVAVLSTNTNAKEVEVEHCADPAELKVSSENPLQINYTITAGANQNGYKYMLLLDGNKVKDLINAGSGTIDATAGMHTVKVISYYNGKLSEGITKTVEVSDGSLRDYVNTPMNLAKGASVTVNTIDPKDEGTKNTKALVDGDINGPYVMTTWGEDNANVIMELSRTYNISAFNEVLIKFVANNTYAKAFDVQFSSNGNNYDTVASVSNVTFANPVEVKINRNAYTQGTVKFVKINFKQKSAAYGYQMREIAVMGNPEDYLPKEAAGLALASPENGAIAVSFASPANNGQTYRIYIDDELVAMNLVGAGTYVYRSLDGGSHIVKVTSTLNGIESKGVTAKISIKESQQAAVEDDPDDDPEMGYETTKAQPTTKKTETTKAQPTTKKTETTKKEETTKVAPQPSGDYAFTTSTRNALLDDTAVIDGKTYTDLISKGGVTASSSSNINAGSDASKAIDNNLGSRWESVHGVDPQFITLNLGKVAKFKKIGILWETASAKEYQVMISNDGTNFTPIASLTDGKGTQHRLDEIVFNNDVTAQFIRIYGTTRSTVYGYSIFDMAVYGEASEEPTTKKVEETTKKVEETTKKEEETTKPIEDVPSDKNIAEGKEVSCSGTENGGAKAENAVDGNAGTRFSSNFDDDAWLVVDLGENYNVFKVVLVWEAAYGKDYDIQISVNGTDWTTAKEVRGSDGGRDEVEFNAQTARFVRMQGVKRALPYGYSIWEMEVYAMSKGGQTTPDPIVDPTVGSGVNVASHAVASQSGSESQGTICDNAFDDNMGTRWSSDFADDAWIIADLGASYLINKVSITWEAAYGKDYDILVSQNGTDWKTVSEVRNSDGGLDDIDFDGTMARFVKLQGVKRALPYGYSIWDMKVITQ